MKRTLTISLAAALFASLLGGIASASEASDMAPAAASVAPDDDRPGVDPKQVLRRCRYLLGENELTDATQERCRRLWNRWCHAYPRTPQCRPERPVDRPIDRPTDRPVDRPTDRPSDRPIDRPVDRPIDRPSDRPAVRPVEPPAIGGPVVGPPDKADLDRVRDRDSHDRDEEGNDTHVRARRADL